MGAPAPPASCFGPEVAWARLSRSVTWAFGPPMHMKAPQPVIPIPQARERNLLRDVHLAKADSLSRRSVESRLVGVRLAVPPGRRPSHVQRVRQAVPLQPPGVKPCRRGAAFAVICYGWAEGHGTLLGMTEWVTRAPTGNDDLRATFEEHPR
jgi:hypothetical protein